jgi:hypothetical protein
MSWRAHADRLFTERVILVAGWLLFLVYAYPGYMSADSVWQLYQARGGEPISDWHPPMMALIWRYLDKLVAGPILMLVLQSATFLIGLHVLLARVMSKRAAAITAVVLLLLPQNIIVMAVIWKDSQMAGFIIAAIPCLLSKRRGWRITGYVLLFLATAVRYNAAAPIFPLVVVLFDWDKAWPWFKRWPAAVGLWVAITCAAFFVNGLIATTKVHLWPVGVAGPDIAGTLYFADDVDADQVARDAPEVPWAATANVRERLARGYKPTNSYKLVFEGDAKLFEYPQTDAQRDALGALWWKLVREHPAAFLAHRRAVLTANLESRVVVWRRFADSDESGAIVHHRASHSSIQDAWGDAVVRITQSRLFRPRIYFYLSLIILVFARRNRLAFAILASGIAHEVGLLAIAPAVEYRYNHWMVATALVGLVLVFIERRAKAT